MTERKNNKLLRTVWVMLAAIILLSAAFGQRASAASTDEYYANAVLFWTNVERVRHGLPAFKTTDAHMGASAVRAKELISNYSHTRPNGSDWSTIFAARNIPLKSAAENIARGQYDPCEVVECWMQSTDHRNTILNSKYTYMGVGVATSSSSSYRKYWEQLFTGRLEYSGARSSFYVAPTGVSTDKNAVQLSVGGTDSIAGIPAPLYATAEISCTSSNPKVVQVTGTEVNIFTIKGLANGSAILTIKCGSYSKNVIVTVGTGKSTGPFGDVLNNDMFCNAVIWATKNGITTGVSQDHFDPYGSCTRGQAVTFIWRSVGSPDPGSYKNPFVDVQNSGSCKPYYNAILWACKNGITNGFDETHFNPSATVTREQFVTFLWRQFGSPKVNISNPFVDVAKGSYYYDAVMWAYKNSITKGFDATHFGVGRPCQRYQVVMFLQNALT